MTICADGCEITGEHNAIVHCVVEDRHCTSMDATCHAELRNANHGITCHVCEEAVICVCEPSTNWVSDQCPIHQPSVKKVGADG